LVGHSQQKSHHGADSHQNTDTFDFLQHYLAPPVPNTLWRVQRQM
jgi:hypothetical protein